MAKHDITGQRFGRLVALRVEPSDLRNTRWRCRCDCGEETVVVITKLRSGHTKSCGCLSREATSQAKLIHGQSNAGDSKKESRLYSIWCNMRARCNRPTATEFSRYGGRGIRVCPEWDSFQAFNEWAQANGYRDDLTIDRIDNSCGYEPANCRWATRAQQTRNSSKARLVEFNGKLACIKEHADDADVSYEALRYRLNSGVPIAAAIAELERVR